MLRMGASVAVEFFNMQERINWSLVTGLAVVGGAAITVALVLMDFSKEALSGILIEFGAGVGLVGAFVLIERRIYRQVATVSKTAVNVAVQAETAALRERIVRLENLDNEQEALRHERHSRDTATADRVLFDELTCATIVELLNSAIENNLIDPHRFRVRSSQLPDSPDLYLILLDDQDGEVAVCLDFESFRNDHLIVMQEQRDSATALVDSGSRVIWSSTDSAASIGARLVESLERRNRPSDGFSFSYAPERLVKSVQVMRTARSSPARSPLRLEGALRILLNDHWAITTHGLEAVEAPTVLPITWTGFGRSGVHHPTHLWLPEGFDDERQGWSEVAAWLSTKEGCVFLQHDEELANPVAGWNIVRDTVPVNRK